MSEAVVVVQEYGYAKPSLLVRTMPCGLGWMASLSLGPSTKYRMLLVVKSRRQDRPRSTDLAMICTARGHSEGQRNYLEEGLAI